MNSELITPDTVKIFVALALTNAGAIIGYCISQVRASAVLRVEVDRLKYDVDNIGGLIGTKKSKGRKKAA